MSSRLCVLATLAFSTFSGDTSIMFMCTYVFDDGMYTCMCEMVSKGLLKLLYLM